MTLEEIDQFCSNLAGCEVRYPFETSPDLRAWCVAGKMFAWCVTSGSPLTVQLKAEPTLIPTLLANYGWISPGYHMNKRHWISVRADAADRQMLCGLLEDAHALVVAKLPRKERLQYLPD